jgi:hypothetical protein
MLFRSCVFLQPLHEDHDHDQPDADRVEELGRVDQHHAGDEQHDSFRQRRAAPRPALEPCRQREDADRGGDGDERDRAPVGIA